MAKYLTEHASKSAFDGKMANLAAPHVAKITDGEKVVVGFKDTAASEFKFYQGGHEYSFLPAYAMVDLGLPSGTKWANMNVGASSEEDFGKYFAWGETAGRTADEIQTAGEFVDGFVRYDSIDTEMEGAQFLGYKKGDLEVVAGEIYGGKYVCSADFETFYATNYTINGNNLSYYAASDLYFSDWYQTLPAASISGDIAPDSGYDAARVNMGADWQMPSKADCQELLAETTQEIVEINGVSGTKFTSKTNSNYIFFPFAGYGGEGGLGDVGGRSYVWSSSFYRSYDAWGLGCYDDGDRGMYDSSRYYGRSVRGVSKN